jgi:hypothetical protein
MTSPLPMPSKPAPAEGARPDMGNFFQFLSPARGGDSSKPDFESFLKQKNSDDEVQEEREAAKSRKKPVEAAAVAAPAWEIPSPDAEKQAPVRSTDSSDPETPSQTVAPDLSKSPEESESATSSPTEAAEPQENSTETQTETPVSENSNESPSEAPEETLPEPPKNEETTEANSKDSEPAPSDANGMETAPTDPEMISLETFDGVESGTAASREPSITSIHRLTAFAATDRNGLAPIGASGNSAESGLGHLATGQNIPLETRSTPNASPAAQASALFKSLGPELEKFRQTGRSQIQLDIPVSENESVRIRLSLRAGELRSTFITESPELREALQKAWPEFAQLSRDRGVRLGDPTFQQGFQDNNPAFGQNARRERGSAETDSGGLPGYPSTRKPAVARPASSPTSSALWA